MRKYFCDKCGMEMRDDRRNVLCYRFNTIGKITSYQSGSRRLDICDNCLKEFEAMSEATNETDEEDYDD